MPSTDALEAARKAAEERRQRAVHETTRLELSDDPHGVDEGNLQGAEHDVAEAQAVPREEQGSWSRPHDLDAPPPRDGFTQRWIRVRLGNDKDPKNSNRKFREGWRPRSIDSIPRGYSPPTMIHGTWGDVIGVEDLVLCEMPVKMARQRNKFYEDKRDRMLHGIDEDLHRVSRDGPRIDKSSSERVTMRRARVPSDPGATDE